MEYGAGLKLLGDFAFSGCGKLRTMIFDGDAPEVGINPFAFAKYFTVYYPKDNTTWTERVQEQIILCGANFCVGIHGENDPHTMRDFYRYDDDSHWKQCTGCDFTEEVAPHRFDSDSDNTCDDCGYERVPLHNFQWEWNNVIHSRKCADCGFIYIEANHNFDDSGICMDCGYDRASVYVPKETGSEIYLLAFLAVGLAAGMFVLLNKKKNQ